MNLKLIISLVFLSLIIGLSFFRETDRFESFSSNPKEKREKVTKSVQVFPEDCDWQAMGRVLDGDTIRLQNGVKVRYIGINTPEIDGPYTTEQFFGPEASRQMHEFLDNVDRVCLLGDTKSDAYDKYDRRLAYVYNEKGENLNLEMVLGGFARVYRKFDFDKKDEFLEAEQIARSRALGLWE